MTRVRARRDLSRLFLSFSSSDTRRLPCNLILLFLGLVSVRSVLPCGEKTRPQSHDLAAFPYLADNAERKYSRRDPDDPREWMQRGLNVREVSGSPEQSFGIGAGNERGSRRRTGALKRMVVGHATNRFVETSGSGDGSRFATLAPEIANSYHGESRKRHGKRKLRRENFGGQAVDRASPKGAGYRGNKYIELRTKRRHKLEKKSGSKVVGLEELLAGCEECDFVSDDDPRSVRRNRSDKMTNNLEVEENNRTENPIHPDAIEDLSQASNESYEEPFTGFEGSQKFPIKVTYKPPVAPQVEKFDRRHFGPPKMDVPETTDATYPSTLLPDLPKSPGRDVLHRHRKVDENTEEERRQEAVEMNERANDTADDRWLPGASSGRRASNIAGGKAVAEEKRVSTSTSSSSTLTWTTVSEIVSENGSRVTQDGKEDEEYTERSVTVSSVKPFERTNITILGLFEMTRGTEPRPEGPSELQAARLAVERVNEMNVLSKFRLHLIYNDTKCDPGVAVDRFFHALYSAKKNDLIPLLLGTACSEVTETLAKIVPYWNVIQVSFGSTAPALSDTTEFPLFLRTVAPDSSHNSARIALIKYFGWDTVTALSQTGDMYSLAVNDLVTELEQANITCTATITFAENDYKEQLRTLKELDTRIIIGSFSPRLAPRVFCEAWKLGMHGGDYAWILPGDTIDLSVMAGNWWHSGPEECTPSQLSQTLDGLIIVKSHGSALDNEISSSGLTSSRFTSELARRGVTHSRYAGQTYDAVWAMALALEKTEDLLNIENKSVAQYTHTRMDIATRLSEQLKLLRFVGVSNNGSQCSRILSNDAFPGDNGCALYTCSSYWRSPLAINVSTNETVNTLTATVTGVLQLLTLGPVSFDGADRVGITAFYQMHGHVIRRIAIFSPEDGKLIMNCPGCAMTRWPGGHPPAARRVFRLRMVTVAPAAFLAVACLASVGVTLALAFLAFNLHFRRHKSIKLSSPRLNNMAAVGCGLVYGAVILLGLDHATLPDSNDYYPTVCTARVYLLSAGFSLAFGSMFTKTYRVHRIFTRSRSGVVKNKLLQDTQLISLICVLLLIDGLVVTLWVTFDPMQRHLRNLTLEISPQDRGVVYQPQVEVCRSQHTNSWLGALYVYKGLLLIVGVYMAWETRHVKIPALNDSQYIGMSVYFVVITSGIVVVLANLMSDRATLAFVTITALILASTTATLALLFLPQLTNILAGERADPVVQSLGLKIECNTRRFVTDDRTELQYRVEVQNRVYRREMAQLELELARLEKQLAQEPVEPSHASSSASIPQRNPSIGGGLPLLLLSVLPPVIPRASWPYADPSGIRRGTVAFSSQPDMETDGARRSLADIYKLHRRRGTVEPNRLGVFQRLFSLFGSRPASRKTSTTSATGVASALRAHMGYIAGLVPGTKAASTCQMNAQGTRSPHPRCGSGPIISITSEEDRRLSLGLRRKESSEPRVNFSLPPKASTSQTSSREKIRGSPRFPHRIVPANSLNAIAPGCSISRSHRWHSMEDARKTKVAQLPRGSSCSPGYDVWATRELGIPLSELGNSAHGKKVPESLALTIMAESSASTDNARLGGNLRKLLRESSAQGSVSPTESELKITRSASSSSSSPTNTRTSSATNEALFFRNESRSQSAQLDAGAIFVQDSEDAGPSSSTVHTTNLDAPEEASDDDDRGNESLENGKSTAAVE